MIKNMIDLIMLTNSLSNKGPVRVMLDIAKNIDTTKIKPIVLTLMPDDKKKPIAESFEKQNIEIHRLNFSFLDLELKTDMVAKKVEAYIAENFKKPVVQAHGYHPTLLISHMSLPSTVTMHCISKEDYVPAKGVLLGNYMVWRFARNLKHQKYPVAISSYMKDYYKKVCDNPISLIYNGVSYRPVDSVDIHVLKKNLNIPEGKKVVLVTGELSKRKNGIHIINQLKKLSNDDFNCIFVGTGPLADTLKAEAESDHRIRFEGFKSNVKEYLQVADVFVSASTSEGLPLAVLEAICMGVPALLSDIPPHKEIVEKVSHPSIKCFSLSSDELSEYLISHLKQNWDKNGISKISLKYFSSDTMGEEYTKLIEKICMGNDHK